MAAAKRRLLEEDDDNHQQPNPHKRPKPTLASAIREVLLNNFFHNFCSAFEPMLRTLVSEEVENQLRRRCTTGHIPRPPPMLPTTTLHLAFPQPLSLPIFTGTKILHKLLLLHHDGTHAHLPLLKLQIVVLDGDFPHDSATGLWTHHQFSRSIVKERTGKPPLLAGDLAVTMRDGIASLDLQFTDNSSWIRSRKFRIGARATSGTIREAITEAFVVKDHRGESYKKHHPPELRDEVWRLEKIGKGGTFHQKLEKEGIQTVQDFLKLFHVDPSKLRSILGVGMSDKLWSATWKHAKECVLGNKLYKFHSPNDNSILTFTPACQLITFESNGQIYRHADLARIHTGYMEILIKEAYAKWNTLEAVDGPMNHSPLLLTQGEVAEKYPNDEEITTTPSLYLTNNSEGDGMNQWESENSINLYAYEQHN